MRNYSKVFRESGLLEEMLSLREEGWAYNQLARKYNVDHTSIRYHCIKAGLADIVVVRRLPLLPAIKKKPNSKKVHPILRTKESINRGKTYLEYLDDMEKKATHPHTLFLIRRGREATRNRKRMLLIPMLDI